MSTPTPDETILGLLAAGQARHGYQLLDIFHDPTRLGMVWKLSASQLYAVLKRLEQHGWVTGEQVEVENAPSRTEYALTEVGAAHLREWLNEPAPSPSIRRVRVDLLSRLYVARLLGLPTSDILARQRVTCEQQLARLHEQFPATDTSFGGLAIQLGVAQLRAVLQWMSDCESQLRATDANAKEA